MLADGSARSLLRKNLRRRSLSAAALRAKPNFLPDPRREPDAYASLAGGEFGVPTVLAQGADWLLLEHVGGTVLSEIGEVVEWQRAARWLTRLHGSFAHAPPDQPSLIQYDGDYYSIWPRRAREHVGPALDVPLDGYERVVERLAALPRTFVHGEFYASNILVAGDRVAAVDWEMAGVGTGLLDLAALTSGTWEEGDRRAIEDGYGPVDEEALMCCRLHLAMQWLGWSTAWLPPAEHAHDWLREAVELRERLSL